MSEEPFCDIEYKRYITFGFKGEWLGESWLCRYLIANQEKYDLKILKRSGPADYIVEYHGILMVCEVEWHYYGYGVHLAVPKFSVTNLLVCLDTYKPVFEEEGYPKHTLWIPTIDFMDWYFKTTGLHSEPLFSCKTKVARKTEPKLLVQRT